MTVPKYHELMKPMLELIKDGKPHKLKEIYTLMEQQSNLSAEDLAEMLPSGRSTLFRNRAGWAKTYLKKAGLLEYPMRASIAITEAGKRVIAENPKTIDAKYLARFPSFVEFWGESRSKGDPDSDSNPETSDSEVVNTDVPNSPDLTPDDQLEDAYKQINANLASDLLGEVLKITPYAFEKLVVDLLSKMGYGTVAYGSHATVASGDDGIDGVIMEDKLGFSLIYMQAKQWTPDKTVGQPDIQSFVGAIAGKHGDGLFVTTAKFSQKAKDYANTHHIILIDGTRLANLMLEHNFCVYTKRTFEVKDIDMNALADYQDE